MRSYFIYYRVSPEMRGDAQVAVNQVLALVAGATGVQGRLMHKDDASDTWMEIYEGVSDQAAFDSAMRNALATARFDRLLAADSQRHVERFIAAAPA